MNTVSQNSGLEILMNMTSDFHEAGIPPEQQLALITDHLMGVALALPTCEENPEHVALAVISRMESILHDWKAGTPPFGDGEAVESQGDVPLDVIRIAYEHLTEYAGLPAPQAATCMGLFAMGVLHRDFGMEMVHALLNTLECELEGLETNDSK